MPDLLIYATLIPCQCLDAMSDLQLLTGSAILISGYVSLKQNLPVYYWQIIVNLGWFSALTHLATMTFLHRRQDGAKTRMRRWKVCAMIVFLALMVVALIPIASYELPFLYYDVKPDGEYVVTNITIPGTVGAPARCYFKVHGTPGGLINTIFSLIFLIFSYQSHFLSMAGFRSGKVSSFLSTKARAILDRLHNIGYEQNSATEIQRSHSPLLVFLVRSTIHPMGLSLYLTVQSLYLVFSSMLWDVSLRSASSHAIS